jgi:hypothetical protein
LIILLHRRRFLLELLLLLFLSYGVECGLIDISDGEVARWFSAFFIVEGGGRTQRYDLIKDKPLLICYGFQPGRDRTRERVKEFSAVAIDAGVKVTVHEMADTAHAFPPKEYPFVRQWLREVALK